LPSDYDSLPNNKSDLFDNKRVQIGVEILENASYEDVFEQLKSLFKSLELKK
jgi:hypothetical protein